MNQRWHTPCLAALTALGLTLTRPGWAAAPASPWANKDIGAPAVAGSSEVDANGVWTVKGSGDDIFNYADNFQYAYQTITGDGSITAQILSRTGGDGQWAKAGLMVRANDTDGSANVNFTMTPGHGLHCTSRLLQGEACVHFAEVGPSGSTQPNTFMRLQRVGNEVAGFYSKDGQIWTQAGFSPVLLPSLEPQALFGLAVSSVWNGKITTAKFAQVSVQPGIVSAYGFQAFGADRTVLLQWHPVPSASGFNLYRGPADLTTGPLVKLNDHPVAGTTYTDASDALVDGSQVTYVIAPVFMGSDGKPVEGPKVALPATPVAVPDGWLGASINEGPRYGSVAIDPTTGQITLQGAGGDIWNATEQGYFFGALKQGNFQITVRALTKPSPGSTGSPRAGLMIRESLDGTARRTLLALTPDSGLIFQTRASTLGYADQNDATSLTLSQITTPLVIRLTRQGKTILSESSSDDGKTFQPAGNPFTFDEGLPGSVYAGLYISSPMRYTLLKARFTGLEVKSLQP